MRKKIALPVCLFILAWLAPTVMDACTTFCLKDKIDFPINPQ
ncbi:MAG TPA: hypothetical protein VMZ49_11135 [Patescibacteria group bacterium]|nr:hypothetical protein [Patescibacteria group bacterium]